MKDSEWLQQLKIGDKVYSPGKYGEFGNIYTVNRLTNTQIVIKEINGIGKEYEIRFRKFDGFNVGGNSWSRSLIVPVTDKVLERQRIHILSNRANMLKQTLELPKLTEEEYNEYITHLSAAHEVCKNHKEDL